MSDIPETTYNPALDTIEEAGMAFNPASQHLDLSKAEKRRTTALLMAITAYEKLIIKDAAYLKESLDAVRRNEMPPLTPASINAMVDAAIKFDAFIAGAPISAHVTVELAEEIAESLEKASQEELPDAEEDWPPPTEADKPLKKSKRKSCKEPS